MTSPNPLRTGLWALLLAAVLASGFSAAYTLDETEQAVVLQFGKPVGDTVTEAGLHFKLPFVQEVRVFDRPLLVWDGAPNQIPTRGREFISVDTTARWRIADALQFLRSVRDESGAQSRLDDILDSVVRDEISSTDLVEIVRSADWDVSAGDLDRAGQPPDRAGDQLTAAVEVGRQQLTRAMLDEASKSMPQYGIELVDLRIKRLNYIPSVQERVFDRMISERERIAEQFRSEGEGEASRIRGETARLLAEIRSEAQRRAAVIRGEADAEAASLFNDAYGVDPEFYAFWRSLESYRVTLADGVLVLGADADYLGYLAQPARRQAPTALEPPAGEDTDK
jgi:membrane protease subunit HflC